MLAVVALLALSPGTALAKPAPKRYYVFKSVRVTVKMTVWRSHVYRLSLSANGTCEDGTETSSFGVGIIGGRGLPIRGRKHRFNYTRFGSHRRMIFRGVVHERSVKGGYLESFEERIYPPEGSTEEVFPYGQDCGVGSPKGTYIHFTARRVGRSAVPKWMR